MTLKFHNTLTGKLDDFKPISDDKALVYTCGPTVYDYPHIGNWSAYIYWDILIRVLIANNFEVVRVMNITDVGHLVSDGDEGQDKLEKGAHRESKTAWDIANFYTDDFINSLKLLNMIMPQHIARATDFIPQQLDLVRQLKQKGYTYQTSDGIYYDTSKFPTYANFAHLNLDELKAGARVEHNKEKRNSSDFALWKFSPVDQKRDMQWPTPIDLLETDETINGFPGWHLECSAMAMTLLGSTIDIHTGGIDHIPVHHSNEIAQSEAVSGVRFSNYWLHNNHLKVNGTKISKSLGNGYTLDDLAEKGFSMQDFRMFVLQGNYKSEGNFTFDNLTSAKNRLQNWLDIATIRHQVHNTIDSNKDKLNNSKTVLLYATSQAIVEAASYDLNTPKSLKIIDEAFARVASAHLKDIHRPSLINLMETIDKVLGFKLIESTPDIPDDAKRIIIERNSARDAKDWVKSDELRNNLLKLGISVKDSNSETIWQYIPK